MPLARSCSTESTPPQLVSWPCGEEAAPARRLFRHGATAIDQRGVLESPGSRAPRWRIAIAVSALAMLAGLAFPPAQVRADALIWEGNDQSVLLAPQDDGSAPPNDHPVSLEPRAVEKMLSDLRFRYADQESDAPPAAVFNSEQVDILGEAIAAGLERATPSQDITFSIIGAHRLSPGAFARRNRLTAGRVFFRDGKLNLILGEIQSPYRKKNIYGRIEQDFHPRQYGSRAAPEAQESLLVASAAAALHDDDAPGGAARHDWVVFDPDVTDENAGRTALPPQAVPGRPHGGTLPADEGSATREDSSQQAPDAGQDIEARLETLKRLRDKELISDDAYRQKVDEILEDL